MTSKQYYKQTSDMAYPLNFIMKDEDNEDKIIANITLSGKNSIDASKILDENDFFALPEDFDIYGIDIENVELEIRFHYGIDDLDCYNLNVCDVIDCTSVDGGRVVLSCNGYTLGKSVRPKSPSKCDCNNRTNVVPRKSIFDIFDDIVGCSSCLGDLFNFPKFPDISKMMDETRKNIEDNIERSKNDGNAKFYNFSCKIDPDGKVHIKRSSNEGTVEKEFMIGDNKSSEPKKIKVEDDPKTELRNLVK